MTSPFLGHALTFRDKDNSPDKPAFIIARGLIPLFILFFSNLCWFKISLRNKSALKNNFASKLVVVRVLSLFFHWKIVDFPNSCGNFFFAENESIAVLSREKQKICKAILNPAIFLNVFTLYNIGKCGEYVLRT